MPMSMSMSWVVPLSLLAAAPRPGASVKKGEDAQALRARATQLYGAKKYAEACPLFERASKLAPEHGPTLADLGLCLQKQGKTAQARAAFLRALKASDGDPTTRANVYFNLASFHDATPKALTLVSSPGPRGASLAIPDDGPCAPLPSSEPSCRKKLEACIEQWSTDDAGSSTPSRRLSAGGFNLRVYGGGEPDGSADAKPGFCDNAPAVGNVASPPAQTCLYWSSNLGGVGCQPGDAPCQEELAALREDEGRCKLVHVEPCRGRVGVSCEGTRFQSKKVWVGEVSVVPAR